MSWPSPTDYNEAVQNPRLGFDDLELKLGQPELTPLGTPRPYSGAFATVYKLQCGPRTWAVRCFNREYHDQQERYEAIGAHLAKVRLPYTVAFEYLRRGILVHGAWYPIVKMEWIRGETLSSYIAQNLGRIDALLDLADQWQKMLADLGGATVAHGDLSHGNILVVEGRLRLVDYDGMFVPALTGRETHEIGHRNYQHPARTKNHFGPNLDHFSAWVVYLSLLALSAEPGLWQQFHGGDECLLLRRTDFEDPAASPLFTALSLSPDPRTRRAALEFQTLLRLPPDAAPALGGATARPPSEAVCAGCGRPLGARLTRCPQCGREVIPGRPASLPDWLADHLPVSPPPSEKPTPGPAEEPGEPSDISWIFERLSANTTPAAFAAPSEKEHLLFWAAVLLSTAAAGAAAFSLLPLLALLGTLAMLYPILFGVFLLRYRRDPAVRQRLDGLRKLRPVERRLRKLDHKNRTDLGVALKFRDRETRLAAAHRQGAAEIDAEEHGGLAAVKASFQNRLNETADARRRMQIDESAVLRRLDAEFTRKIFDLTTAINGLPQDELLREEAALRKVRSRALVSHLQNFPVDRNQLPGLGSSAMASLINSGIRTAADVVPGQVNRVRALGPQKITVLIQWRQRLEASAVLPATLPAQALQTLRAETETKRRALHEERQKKQNQLANERAIVRNSYAKSREDLDRADSAAQAKAQAGSLLVSNAGRRQRQRLQSRFEPQFQAIADRLHRIQAEAGEYRRETCELAWKRSQLLHRLGPFRALTFGAYLHRLIAGK